MFNPWGMPPMYGGPSSNIVYVPIPSNQGAGPPEDPLTAALRAKDIADKMVEAFKPKEEKKKDEKTKKGIEKLSQWEVFLIMILFSPLIGPAMGLLYNHALSTLR